MITKLIRNAALLVTMDDNRREIPDSGFFIRDHVIEAVGPSNELPATADEVWDLRDHVIIPGLINTHHHLYQTLTRGVPGAQDVELFDWLRTLYPIWAELTNAGVYTSTLVGLGELLRSGCTTASDHLYIYPNDVTLDESIRAAQEIGMRFHASRGSMSLGESKGGLPPDRVVEEEDAILHDAQRLIETYHDAGEHAMLRIVVAPCSPFSVTPELMRAAAELARSYGVHLHTHLAETLDEEHFCLDTFGHRPVAYAEELGWIGDDVWYAHGIHVNEAERALMARTGTGVAHCPSSNMRIAAGVCPVREYLDVGVHVGLGVDGSASNEGSNLLSEVQNALFLQRVTRGAAALTVREALELGTRGSATVLGRDDIGQLAPGKAADFAAFDLNRLEFAGAWHDPLAAIVLCTPSAADRVMVHGRMVVQEREIVSVDMGLVIERHNHIAREMVQRAGAR